MGSIQEEADQSTEKSTVHEEPSRNVAFDMIEPTRRSKTVNLKTVIDALLDTAEEVLARNK